MRMLLGNADLAKYPYMKEAHEFIQKTNLDLVNFSSPELRPIIIRAFLRVKLALDGQLYKSTGTTDAEIISFHLGCMLVKVLNNPRVINKFALAEARRAEKLLISDLRHNEMMISKIIMDLFGMSLRRNGNKYYIPIPDYVMRSVHFNQPEWKLINRLVHDGSVILTSSEAIRLIRNELANMIGEKIKGMHPKLPESFTPYIEELTELTKHLVPKTEINLPYPPCIIHALEVLKKGENLPHTGRFMLATFMLKRGMELDDVVQLFATAPDYNESITRYQVKQLAGGTTGQKYMCPSCDKLRTYGLCYIQPECKNIKNPIQFGS